MKTSVITSAIASLVLGMASFGANAVIVNIGAYSANNIAPSQSITLAAGTYNVSWVGAGFTDGLTTALYSGWTYQESSTGVPVQAWREAYTVTDTGTGVVRTYDLADPVKFNSYATAAEALAAFQITGAGLLTTYGSASDTQDINQNKSLPFSFTISDTTTFVYTLPDNKFSDNSGGVSLSITAAVPEPETYALMLGGLGALAFVARRRKANAA